MSVYNLDGTEAQPIGFLGGIDFEVTGTGPFEWTAWDEDVCVGKGTARTKAGLALKLLFAERRISRQYA